MFRVPMATLSLMLIAALPAVPAVGAQDEVNGTMDLTFNSCWAEPGEAIPDWIGTVTIDGEEHGMLFFNVGSGRPPNTALPEHLFPFNEIWAIYEDLDVAFDEECALQKLEGELVLWGHDHGISDLDAETYSMTGTVVEAVGDYADLAGRDVEMSGTFNTLEDGTMLAPGEFAVG